MLVTIELKMNKFEKLERLRTSIKLLLMCGLVTACTNDGQQQMQNILQQEFIATYIHVTEHHSVAKNFSSQFEYMKKVNSDAFNSIAYRWHIFATEACKLSSNAHSHPQLSGYEKMLAEKTSNEGSIEITRDEDRKCLANIYLSNWRQINKMLALNYPNSK